MKTLRRFIADETAATAVEYGLIVVGITGAIYAIVNSIGTNLQGVYTSVSSSLK